MQLELTLPNVVLGLQIMRLVLIIHIIGLQYEGLLLLEEVVDLDLRHEVWIQIIVNALRAPDLCPQGLVPLLLELV